MSRIRILAVLVLLLAVWVGQAWGADWYVDNVKGIDAGNTSGASGSPFKTITKALSMAGNSEVIHVVASPHWETNIHVNVSVTIVGEAGYGPSGTVVQDNITPAGTDQDVFLIDPGCTVTIKNLTIRHSTVSGPGYWGRGIFNQGTLILEDVVISNNHAMDGLDSYSTSVPGGPGESGGGIYNDYIGTLNLTRCQVIDNIAGDGGMGYAIYEDWFTDSGPGGHGGGVFSLGKLELTDCTFRGNRAGSAGAWGENGGAGGHGGAVYNEYGNVLSITRCTFYQNYSGWGGTGRDYNGFGGNGGSGGAVYSNESANIVNCTFNSNTAALRGDTWGIGSPGLDGIGAAICGDKSSTVSINSCTICSNLNGGGVYARNLVLLNSIVALNTHTGQVPTYYPDISSGGSLTSQGYNFIGDLGSTTFNGNTTGDEYGDPQFTTPVPNLGATSYWWAIDPKVDVLKDNGGPTWTQALLSGSPALDAGAPLGIPTKDQRGRQRYPAGMPDKGAYECTRDVIIQDYTDDFGDEPQPMFVCWVSPSIYNTLTPTTTPCPDVHTPPVYPLLNYLNVYYVNNSCYPVTGSIRLYYTPSNSGAHWGTAPATNTIVKGATNGDWVEITQGTGPAGPIAVNIGPNSNDCGAVEWYPPDPSQYTPLGNIYGHYCLLARFESTIDPMFLTETSNTVDNVQNNNNIAAHNIEVAKKKKAWWPLIVRNVDAVPVYVDLRFTPAPEDSTDGFFTHGTLTVNLGNLYDRWQAGGGMGAGIESVGDSSIVTLAGREAWLRHIPLDPNHDFVINLQFNATDSSWQPGDQPIAVDVIQYSAPQSGGEAKLDGGMRYEIDWEALTANEPIVSLEKTHNTVQGQYEHVSITWKDYPLNVGGFDFLIAYDASALSFTVAKPGQLLEDCGWEYFTYRYGADGNCGEDCSSGLLRLVAIAETNDGSNHPSCFGPPDTDPHELAVMKFMVTNDRTFECQYVPIRFFWGNCSDNSISSVTGDTLFVSNQVYDLEGTDLTDPTVGFPTYFGIQQECLEGSEPGKPVPIPFINFVNGGIDIICADSIDSPGDINVNNLPYEIADAVMFTNYFVNGLSAFGTHVDASVAASDVNKDGLTLSVADLVYLIRVVIGDAQPYPKLTPVEARADLTDGVLSINAEIGAAYVRINGQVTPVLLAENMEMKYGYDSENDVTRILVYSMEKGRSFQGRLLGSMGDKSVKLEMATYNGTPVVARVLPTQFALHQNHPNPFNPVTEIQFALPVASDVRLTIYNVLGQTLATPVDGHLEAGNHTVTWDGSAAASGVYLYRLEAGDFVATKKMMLLK